MNAKDRQEAVLRAAKRMNQVIDDLPIPDTEKQVLKADLARRSPQARQTFDRSPVRPVERLRAGVPTLGGIA